MISKEQLKVMGDSARALISMIEEFEKDKYVVKVDDVDMRSIMLSYDRILKTVAMLSCFTDEEIVEMRRVFDKYRLVVNV